jgi:hypothetical protein
MERAVFDFTYLCLRLALPVSCRMVVYIMNELEVIWKEAVVSSCSCLGGIERNRKISEYATPSQHCSAEYEPSLRSTRCVNFHSQDAKS